MYSCVCVCVCVCVQNTFYVDRTHSLESEQTRLAIIIDFRNLAGPPNVLISCHLGAPLNRFQHAAQYTHRHTHTRAHTHARTHAHTRTHTHIQTYIYAYITHTHTHTHIHTHTHTYTHIHIHIHIHIHMHVCMGVCKSGKGKKHRRASWTHGAGLGLFCPYILTHTDARAGHTAQGTPLHPGEADTQKVSPN
jgi:hypothetical protein